MQLWRFWLKLLAVRTGQAQIFSEDRFLCIWHFNAKHTTCLTRDTKHTTCLISSSQELTTTCTGDCTESHGARVGASERLGYIAFHEPQQLDDDGHREHIWQCIQHWNSCPHYSWDNPLMHYYLFTALSCPHYLFTPSWHCMLSLLHDDAFTPYWHNFVKLEQREYVTIPIPRLLVKMYVGVISSDEPRLELLCLFLALCESVRQCFYRELYG